MDIFHWIPEMSAHEFATLLANPVENMHLLEQRKISPSKLALLSFVIAKRFHAALNAKPIDEDEAMAVGKVIILIKSVRQRTTDPYEELYRAVLPQSNHRLIYAPEELDDDHDFDSRAF
jgi:hypothetical protein